MRTATMRSTSATSPIRSTAAARFARSVGLEFVDLCDATVERGGDLLLPPALQQSLVATRARLGDGRSALVIGVPVEAAAVQSLRSSLNATAIEVVGADRDQVARLLEGAAGEQADAPLPQSSSRTPRDGRRHGRPQGDPPGLAPAVILPDPAMAPEADSASRVLAAGNPTAGAPVSPDPAPVGPRALRVVNLDQLEIADHFVRRLPEALGRLHHAVCIGEDDQGRAVVAVSNERDVVALDEVRTAIGSGVEFVWSPRAQIDELLDRVREGQLLARTTAESVGSRAQAVSTAGGGADEGPVVQFVNATLRQALGQRASDIHLEPTEGDLEVRFRIDGVLHAVSSAPKSMARSVTTRLKVMADLDIAEHRLPQDGRITVTAQGRQVDLRVATLPTLHGEKIVLRVLDRATAPLDLDGLGFLPDIAERYATAYTRPSGTILITGPTGSGKSTTLYATLNRLNSPERNLITIEDPAEYQLAGINQMQVNPKAGLHFANALRAMLRADPDVLLVGEIRDRETAAIAIEAALTGHLVLSCLHTADAASVALRLIEMGVEPFLVSASLDCVLAQRLARVLCPSCAASYRPTSTELVAAGFDDRVESMLGDTSFRRPVGCPACSHTGYRGRIALQEVMLMSEDLEQAVLARAAADEIRAIAVREGMLPLRVDGLRKAATGLTSLEEIVRVVA